VKAAYRGWADHHALLGRPDPLVTLAFTYIADQLRWGPLGRYIWHSRRVPGWIRGSEAIRLAHVAFALPPPAVVVEIGSFLGCSTVLLAGARKLRGSGKVLSIDPFDASGDVFSVPIYEAIRGEEPRPLRTRFERNLARAGVSDWVDVQQGKAEHAAHSWSRLIDLLFLDGNQSHEHVNAVYDVWHPFLKKGGILVVHNSRIGYRQESHDGSARLVEERIRPAEYVDVEYVDSMTFAKKVSDSKKQ